MGFAPRQNMGQGGSGIDTLRKMTEITISQRMSATEIITGCDTSNKYDMYQHESQIIFSAREESECMERCFCGPLRNFQMPVLEPISGQEVFKIVRPLSCQGCCCPCCMQAMQIYSPDNQLWGTIEEEWSIWDKHWVIKDPAGQPALKVNGPCCHCVCFAEVLFPVTGSDGESPVGNITKQWTEGCREMCTNMSTFSVAFPEDLDVGMKASLIGATLLIDFMFYQNKNSEG